MYTCTLTYAHWPHVDTFQTSTVALCSSHNNRLDACNVMYIGGIITSWRRLRAICNNTLLDVSVTSLHTFTVAAAAAGTPRHAVFAVSTSPPMYFTMLLATDVKNTQRNVEQYPNRKLLLCQALSYLSVADTGLTLPIVRYFF